MNSERDTVSSRMATSSSTLTDPLYCAICTEIFNNPVSLSCQHTFCKRCLEQSREAGLPPCCPECRAPIMERNFQINRLVRNMADQLRLGQSRQENTGGQRSTAEKGDECLEHGEAMKLFCVTDRKLICLVCKEGRDHRGHTFRPVREAQEDLMTEVVTALGILKEDLNKAQHKRESQQRNISKRGEKSSQVKENIRTVFEEVINKLKQREQEAMREIDRRDGLVNIKMEKHLTEIKRHETDVKKRETSLQSGLDITDPRKFLQWWTEKGRATCDTRQVCPDIYSVRSLSRFLRPRQFEGYEDPDTLVGFIDWEGIEKSLKWKFYQLEWADERCVPF
ncbi:nuclear factor 7, brain-like [Oncorhynchus nerka]|uniref:nuclear factor 7, brain-like n=1 Tax=Oncorhynchus nerka TaxID=8023 RepID=UPI001131BA18|nr:nuclear factor 7, brain-like [Oncorhynchus nerka]